MFRTSDSARLGDHMQCWESNPRQAVLPAVLTLARGNFPSMRAGLALQLCALLFISLLKKDKCPGSGFPTLWPTILGISVKKSCEMTLKKPRSDLVLLVSMLPSSGSVISFQSDPK